MRTAKVFGGRVMYADQERRRRPLKHFAAKGKAHEEFFSGGGDPFSPVQRPRRRLQAPKAGFFDAACLNPQSRDLCQVCLLV